MGRPKLDKSMEIVFGGDAFARADEGNDALFFAQQRDSHLDARALVTVERLIEALVVEDRPAILDLMAGADSHLPPGLEAARVAGLGVSAGELKRNGQLTERVLHDLNRDPEFPFEEAAFDLVLNTISVFYLTRPFEVFSEVARVLKPGGLHLVLYTGRFFAQKAVAVWQRSTDNERQLIVEDYFAACGEYERPQVCLSAGRALGGEGGASGFSDTVYAIYAERSGGDPARSPRPRPSLSRDGPTREEVEERKRRVHQTLCCPYCDELMTRWEVPDTPFCSWDVDHVYVCFNDRCPYFVGGFEVMGSQGNAGFTYRLVYNPERNSYHPSVVPNPATVRKSMLMPRG